MMGKCVLNYLDNHIETEYNCGTSVYKGNIYIWELGTRKNRQPRRVISLSLLKSIKKNGVKGITLTKY